MRNASLPVARPAAGDHRGEDQRRPDQLAGKPCQPLLQRRTASGSASSTSWEMRPSSVATPGADHDSDAAAARDGRALEQHRGAVAEARIRRDRLDRLLDRDRLAGERRIRRRQTRGFDQPQVGRHHVARLQQHDVARHELGSAGTSRTCPSRRTRAERLPSARSASIERAALNSVTKPISALSGEHGDDGAALLQLAEVERQPRRRGQQIDDGALELVQQHRSALIARVARMVFGPKAAGAGGRPPPR